MSDHYCKHCPRERFVAESSGSGWVRLQCPKCKRWQTINLGQAAEAKAPVAGLARTG